MASFWSRSRDNLQTNSGQRVGGLLGTIIGILIIGGLLFGVFMGSRWLYAKLTDDQPNNIATQNTDNSSSTGQTSNGSSTSDQSPSGSQSQSAGSSQTQNGGQATIVASGASTSTPQAVPNTGPTENYLLIFFSVSIIAYIAYRKKLLSSIH